MNEHGDKIHEWVGTAGAVTAIMSAVVGFAVVAWTKLCRPVCTYLKNFGEMPSNVATIRENVHGLDTLVRQAHMIAEGKFEILFADVRRPIWESDEHGNCIRCNREMLHVLGRTFEDISGQNWRGIIAQEDRERVAEEWDDCVAKGRTFEMSYSWVHKDGTRIPIYATGIVIKDVKSGGLLRVVGIVTLK